MTNPVIKYLLKNDMAEIPKRGNKNLKSIIIDGRRFRYNKDKPISNALQKKLDTYKKTQEYKSHITNSVRNTVFEKRVENSLKTYVMKKRARVVNVQRAFKRYANSFTLVNEQYKGEKGLSYIQLQKTLFKKFLREHKNMKLNIRAEGLFTKPSNDGEEAPSQVVMNLPSTRFNIHNEDDLNNALETAVKQILLMIENLEMTASNLSFVQILSITFHYDKYNPTRAGSYILLPEFFAKKKACINIKNEDNKCFKYCIQCHVHNIHEKKNPQEFYHYKNLKDDIFDWSNVRYPVGNMDIQRFEEANDKLISVNVYEPDDVFKNENNIPIHKIRTTKVHDAKYHVNLFRIYDENGKYHYVYIKSLSRLMGSQANKHKEEKHYCNYCDRAFSSKKVLENHYEKGCLAVEGQKFTMPKKGSCIEFKKYDTKLKCPYVIYGDFECLTQKVENKGVKGSYQEHTPCGFMINVVNSIDKTSTPYLYRGENCMDRFVEKLYEVREQIMDKMHEEKPMIITPEQEIEFRNATRCSICNKNFEEGDKRVRDHCHFTGLYRGCAHEKCNLDYCFRYYKIPVFFHNLKNYDSHLIINKANELNNKLNKKRKIDIISQNSEKFITFSFGNLQFKDSFSFLSSSLDKLVKLNKYDVVGKDDDKPIYKKHSDWIDKFNYTKSNPYINNDKDLDLLTEKGVYPYDYMTDFNKFNETELPPIKDFYSELVEEEISDKEYKRAQKVWKHFNIKNMGEYHDLYLMSDVYLLTDVFENFRDMCLNYYGLDPAHYITLPNFSWSVFLSMTGIKLEQIHNRDMYEMLEKGLRGGMTQCTYKKAEANNKYMKNYDENKSPTYINYLDANNLYGLAMSKKLPFGNFKWDFQFFTEKKILNYNDDSDVGYILEVDLEYPAEVHDLHKDYPLAPEVMTISEGMLSNHQKDIHKKYYGHDPKDEKTNKLVLNLMDKKKYVLHISALKFYLEHGMKMKKCHRIISFHQSEFLKPYIDFNTEKRKQAKTDFEKDLFKLLNNSIYGKTMEDVRKHGDFELVNNPVRFQKVVNNPTYKHRHIINEELIGVEKDKAEVELNKPIYMGLSILDYSKVHMYGFYYDVLKPKYDDKINLIYTDTDSFIVHVETDDLYEDFKQMKQHMDFSDYPEDHPNYDKTNKKVLGKFKDENSGKIMTHFIGLKPKSYAFKVQGDKKEQKKSKGIVKHKVDKQINYDMYEQTLNGDIKPEVSFNTIRSKNHQIYSINQTKFSLSNYDNKRWWFDNNQSLPYGHYSIKSV